MARMDFFERQDQARRSTALLVLAFVVAAVGMLFAPRELKWASYGMIVVAFVLHTLAIAARVYISDRPPVTNLYSSAVFIGWALVAFCLVVEAIYRSGLVNLLAGIAGVSTLIVSPSSLPISARAIGERTLKSPFLMSASSSPTIR